MKNCPNCQISVPDEMKFCPNCGTPLPDVNPHFNMPQQPPKPKSNVILIVICSVAMLIICALVVYIVAAKDKDGKPETEQVVEEGDSGNQYGWLSERAVNASDLEGKTAGDLRLMRNAIYARHGFIFKSDDLKEYFGKFSWYEPKYADVSHLLSTLEQKNIAFIQKYEGGGKDITPPAPKSVTGSLKNVNMTNDYSDIVCYQQLSASDLQGLSKAELRILRNTIYARHGRKFKSKDLRDYFNGFSWYNGVYDEISPSSLSAIEKHNIALIQSLE